MSIYPRFFEQVSTDATVRQHLGNKPVRLYPFGQAPIDSAHVYAVWQVIGGTPNRGLSCAPNSDSWTIQVDVYGKQADDVRSAGTALVNAIENTPFGLISAFTNDGRDPATGSYRFGFDVSWWQQRS